MNPKTAHSAFLASKFFPSINGLRALSAIFIVREHTHWHWHLPLPQLFEWGFLGVDLFFVISGFLIVTLLLRERDATGRIDLGSFYVRRTLRIFPAYYLVIFGLFAVGVLTYAHSPKTWELYKWSLPVFLIYGQNLIPVSLGLMFHTWSLAMEEQFYLVWPTVEKFLHAKLVVPLCLVLLVVNQAVNFGFLNGLIARFYNNPIAPDAPIWMTTFTPILLGVLAAHAMHDRRLGPRVCAVLQGRLTPLLLLATAIGACELASGLQGWARASVHVLFCLMLLSLVINPANVMSRFLNWPPLAYLGTISYGVYLYHVFVLACLLRGAEALGKPMHPGVLFISGTAISIVIAAVSFRYFEKPIMALRRRPSPPALLLQPSAPSA